MTVSIVFETMSKKFNFPDIDRIERQLRKAKRLKLRHAKPKTYRSNKVLSDNESIASTLDLTDQRGEEITFIDLTSCACGCGPIPITEDNGVTSIWRLTCRQCNSCFNAIKHLSCPIC